MSARASIRKDRWPPDLDPGPAEWALLEILWQAGPMTRAQVAHAVAIRGNWSPGAAPALLTRLLESGLIRYVDRRRRPLQVQAAVSKGALRQELCRRFAQRHFAGDLQALRESLHQCTDRSPALLAPLKGSSSSEISQSSNAQG